MPDTKSDDIAPESRTAEILAYMDSISNSPGKMLNLMLNYHRGHRGTPEGEKCYAPNCRAWTINYRKSLNGRS